MADLDQVRIRTATPSDAAALRELDEQTPDLMADATVSVDVGEDWFAPTRLMENSTVLVAQLGERIVGALCSAMHQARVAGKERPMVMTHQVRVLPTLQGKGLAFQLVGDQVSRITSLVDGSFYFFIARTNAASQAFARGSLNKWEHAPHQAWLPAGDDADTAPEVRSGTPVDAAQVVEILNTCHSDEEFFLPYSEESLAARLGRAPDLYGWDDVLLGDRAVVGVCAATRHLTWRRDGEVLREEVEAKVLDHGCLPGGEDELDRLLRAAVARAARKGATVLKVFASDGAPCSPVVDALSNERIDLDLWTPSIQEPETSAQGVYVDPIYY
jgi:GNAT superfamily N-acetyltransferase